MAAPDDQPAGELRRRAQLGLPLLLAARRLPDAGGAARLRLRRGDRLWRGWLLRAVAGDPEDMQIMYRVDGARDIPERDLAHLPGYAASPPVRIGNAAVDAAPDRRARRGDDRARAGAAHAGSRRPPTRGPAVRPRRRPRRPLGRARQRTVGDPRPAAPLHALARSWCGRPSTARSRGVEQHGLDGPVEPLARPARPGARGGARRRASTAERNTFVQHYDTTRSTRRCCSSPSWLPRRRRPADARHHRRGRGGPHAGRPAPALPHRRPASTAWPATSTRSSPAPAGW